MTELEELEVELAKAWAELRIMLKWLRMLRPSEAEWSAWAVAAAEARDKEVVVEQIKKKITVLFLKAMNGTNSYALKEQDDE
tara:strand:+ start:115 stop:360 length:246 start_codon:yes stop_codon:yes gene_type:complete